MVIGIPPRKFSCKKCGWSKSIPMVSDCHPEHIVGFEACPRCGNRALKVRYLRGYGGYPLGGNGVPNIQLLRDAWSFCVSLLKRNDRKK